MCRRHGSAPNVNRAPRGASRNLSEIFRKYPGGQESMNPPHQTIVIGSHEVDFSREAVLGPGGTIVPLRPRAWLVLRFLALHAGRLVSKSELMDEVWADCEVTEDSVV